MKICTLSRSRLIEQLEASYLFLAKQRSLGRGHYTPTEHRFDRKYFVRTLSRKGGIIKVALSVDKERYIGFDITDNMTACDRRLLYYTLVNDYFERFLSEKEAWAKHDEVDMLNLIDDRNNDEDTMLHRIVRKIRRFILCGKCRDCCCCNSCNSCGHCCNGYCNCCECRTRRTCQKSCCRRCCCCC